MFEPSLGLGLRKKVSFTSLVKLGSHFKPLVGGGAKYCISTVP